MLMATLPGVKIVTKKIIKFITLLQNVGKTFKKDMVYQKKNMKKWKNAKEAYVLVVSKAQKTEEETVPLW